MTSQPFQEAVPELEPVVFIVDDDEPMRASLCRLLDSAGIRTRPFGHAQAFLDAYDPAVPGCLLLDIRMPGMDGMQLQKHLLDHSITIPIIFITAHGDVETAVRSMQAGAVDFIEKPFRAQALLERIEKAVHLDLQRRQEQESRTALQSRVRQLTPREKEVLQFVLRGQPNRVAAEELGISVKTVEVHRAHIMSKMQASNVTELVQLAILSGIYKPELPKR